jgi:flagellar biosynthetic protein FliR
MGLMANLHLFPLGQGTSVGFDLETPKAVGQGFFAASIKLAAPVLIVTSLINVGLGLLARAAPQVNIFAVGFALLLLGGILVLDTTVLGLKELFEDRIDTLSTDMNSGLREIH